MTPADAIARADRDSAATQALLNDERPDLIDLDIYGVMVLDRVPLNHDPALLRRLLADTERDIYLETVAARGIDPLNQRRETARKDI